MKPETLDKILTIATMTFIGIFLLVWSCSIPEEKCYSCILVMQEKAIPVQYYQPDPFMTVNDTVSNTYGAMATLSNDTVMLFGDTCITRVWRNTIILQTDDNHIREFIKQNEIPGQLFIHCSKIGN
jgi:hypothetical protein